MRPRNLVDGLFAAITTGVTQGRLPGEAWVKRKEAFEELLAVPETTYAWRSLNKGTHDGDGEDFEAGIVKLMVNSLEN